MFDLMRFKREQTCEIVHASCLNVYYVTTSFAIFMYTITCLSVALQFFTNKTSVLFDNQRHCAKGTFGANIFFNSRVSN